MTVVQPNSIAGINSITVQSGNALNLHKADGSLIRTLVAESGISTYTSISVGSAATDNSANNSINIGLGASISNASNNVLTFGTGGDDRATIDASGNLGLGIASPVGNLHVHNSGTGSGDHAYAYFTTGDTGSSGTDGLTVGVAANQVATVNYREAGSLTLATSATERLRIVADGRIIINDTSADPYPTRGLSVGMPANASGNNYIQIVASTTGVSGLTFADAAGQAAGSYAGMFEYYHSGDYLAYKQNASEKLRITSAGDVGVGTITPSCILDVTDNSASGYIAEFRQVHADNPGTILIDSPTDNNIRPAAIELSQAGTVKWGIGQVYQSTASQGFHITAGSATQANSKFVIATNGNTGIGTFNPATTLHVKGAGTDILTLESNNSGEQGCNLMLRHRSPSAADDDIIGIINFNGLDDGGNNTTFASQKVIAKDVSNNSEDGDITWHTRSDGTFAERMRLDSTGTLTIGSSNNKASRLTIVGESASQSGANEGTVTDAVVMIYGGQRSTISGSNSKDSAIIHIKGQINDADANGNGDHVTGQLVFSGRRATGAQSIIESRTRWTYQTQNAGSQLRFYTAPESANGGTAAVERLQIDHDGHLHIPDNGRYSAGAGEDLYLYSDGTNGIIRAPNSNLYLQSDTAVILSDIGGNETFLKCTDDAGVEIYNNNKVVAKTDQYGLIVGDETTDQNAILIVKAAEARDAEIRYYSDQADDNADMWRGINAAGAMQYQSYATGAWQYRLMIGAGANGTIQCCAADQSDITLGGIALGNANIGGKWYATGNTTASLFMFYNPANGNVGSIKTNGAATSFNTSSDYRLKENEVPLENAITKLKGLKPYTFNFKTSPSEKVDGFYAHEAAEVVPGAVTGTKDEMAPTYYKEGDIIPAGKEVGDWTGQYSDTEINPQGVDYGKFTPVLTKALQELVARVETLETELATLKSS